MELFQTEAPSGHTGASRLSSRTLALKVSEKTQCEAKIRIGREESLSRRLSLAHGVRKNGMCGSSRLGNRLVDRARCQGGCRVQVGRENKKSQEESITISRQRSLSRRLSSVRLPRENTSGG